MVIDAHTHIFPPEVISNRDRFFPAEPDFRLLYGPVKAQIAGAPELIDSMDAGGVDYSVVFGFPWRNGELLTRHNDYLMESAAKYPGRMIPFACLDLFSGECLKEAQRCLGQGVAGFGELAVYSSSEDLALALDNFGALAGLCREKGLILAAHANEPVGHIYPGKAPFGLELYYNMAKAAAGTPLILAHWGGGIFLYELLRKDAPEILANVYYDTAASPFLYKNAIYPAAVRILGVEKILFGSDFPLLPPGRYFREMRESGLSTSEMEAVSGGNAARLFGIGS